MKGKSSRTFFLLYSLCCFRVFLSLSRVHRASGLQLAVPLEWGEGLEASETGRKGAEE